MELDLLSSSHYSSYNALSPTLAPLSGGSTLSGGGFGTPSRLPAPPAAVAVSSSSPLIHNSYNDHSVGGLMHDPRHAMTHDLMVDRIGGIGMLHSAKENSGVSSEWMNLDLDDMPSGLNSSSVNGSRSHNPMAMHGGMMDNEDMYTNTNNVGGGVGSLKPSHGHHLLPSSGSHPSSSIPSGRNSAIDFGIGIGIGIVGTGVRSRCAIDPTVGTPPPLGGLGAIPREESNKKPSFFKKVVLPMPSSSSGEGEREPIAVEGKLFHSDPPTRRA